MMTPDQAEQAVVDALACGYRMIDTAQAYMNERAVGRGIKRSGVAREDIFISTKIWASQYLTEGTVEKSLELLGTDYIDLMFIHQPAGDFMAGYRKLETVAIRPMVNQIEMHPYFAQESALKVMEEYQIVPEAWAPLGGGRHNPFDNEMVKEIAAAHGKTVGQVVLRWNVQRGVVVIPKSVHKARIEEIFDVFILTVSVSRSQKQAPRAATEALRESISPVHRDRGSKLTFRFYEGGLHRFTRHFRSQGPIGPVRF